MRKRRFEWPTIASGLALWLGVVACCPKPQPLHTAHEHAPKSPAAVIDEQWEYAAFYAEFAGDLMAPIDVDAPCKYAWTTAKETYSADDIEKIWQYLGVKAQPEYSFNYIEITLINHVSKSGWELVHFNISGVSNPRDNVQSVYRYIFRRRLQ